MGNIPVDIKGLARVIKPLILRLKRNASTSLGPGSALVGGGGWGRRGESRKKNGRGRKTKSGSEPRGKSGEGKLKAPQLGKNFKGEFRLEFAFLLLSANEVDVYPGTRVRSEGKRAKSGSNNEKYQRARRAPQSTAQPASLANIFAV